MPEYFDCKIKAGYYNLFGGPVGEHTFAIAEQGSDTYAFPCFGSFAFGEKDRGQVGVVYPATLWSPYMLFSQPQGQELPANLSVALGMAQWEPIQGPPTFLVSDWDNFWSSLPESLRGLSPSCNAGITYALTGVCQQACNRILWSTQQDWFTYTPVNWPPSFSASYWVYGYYGKLTEGAAVQFAAGLVAEAKRRTTRIMYEVSFDADNAGQLALEEANRAAQKTALRQTRAALKTVAPKIKRNLEVRKMLKAVPGGKRVVDSKQLSGMLGPDEKFNKLKLELDKQLLRGEVSHDEYAGRVNQAFSQMLEEFRNVLPPVTFRAMFRDVPTDGTIQLIARQQMPESYAPVQEMLRI